MSVQVAMGLSEHSKTTTRTKKIKRRQTSGDHLPITTTREECIDETIREGKEVVTLQGRRAYLGKTKRKLIFPSSPRTKRKIVKEKYPITK